MQTAKPKLVKLSLEPADADLLSKLVGKREGEFLQQAVKRYLNDKGKPTIERTESVKRSNHPEPTLF